MFIYRKVNAHHFLGFSESDMLHLGTGVGFDPEKNVHFLYAVRDAQLVRFPLRKMGEENWVPIGEQGVNYDFETHQYDEPQNHSEWLRRTILKSNGSVIKENYFFSEKEKIMVHFQYKQDCYIKNFEDEQYLYYDPTNCKGEDGFYLDHWGYFVYFYLQGQADINCTLIKRDPFYWGLLFFVTELIEANKQQHPIYRKKYASSFNQLMRLLELKKVFFSTDQLRQLQKALIDHKSIVRLTWDQAVLFNDFSKCANDFEKNYVFFCSHSDASSLFLILNQLRKNKVLTREDFLRAYFSALTPSISPISGRDEENDLSFQEAIQQFKNEIQRQYADNPKIMECMSQFENRVQNKLEQCNPEKLLDVKLKQTLAKSILNDAETCFGLNHKVLRILADALMICGCVLGIGFVGLAINYQRTGHYFFYCGKNQEEVAIENLKENILRAT